MKGLKTKKAHRNDVPFSWVSYIFLHTRDYATMCMSHRRHQLFVRVCMKLVIGWFCYAKIAIYI